MKTESRQQYDSGINTGQYTTSWSCSGIPGQEADNHRKPGSLPGSRFQLRKIKKMRGRMIICYACGKKRYGNRNCWRKRNINVLVGSDDEGSLAETEVELQNGVNVNPLFRKVKLNSQLVMFELDSGATYTVMSKCDYLKSFSDLRLRRITVKLTVITGDLLKIAGLVKVKVKCESGRPLVLPLIIIEGNRFCPLMGRNWLGALYPRWRKIIFIDEPANDQSCERERERLLSVLYTEYRELFIDNLQYLVDDFEVSVRVKDHASPVFCKPHEVPFSLKDKVSGELERLVRENILKPVRHADWASPIVVVPMPDGSVRVCMDCKVTMNKVICDEYYPLPNINDVLVKLSGYKYFAKFELQGAHMQIKVTEESQKYLVVNTHKGLYAYERLPFGISSAASTFQRILDKILVGIDGVESYQEDILIGSGTIEGLIATVYEVLDQLQKHKIKVRLNKSELLVQEIRYFGHVVSEKGLHSSDENVKAITEAPRPQNVSQLKSFLDVIIYYSKFLLSMPVELGPLWALLKRNLRFEWDEQCERVFGECQKLLLSSDLLELYSPELPIVIVCDASSSGVGVVLCHKVGDIEKPVFYVSSTLSVTEKNFPKLHREALAVVFGLTKFFKYINGKRFTIVTDSKPLASIFNFKKGIPLLTVTRLQNYVHRLASFDFEIECRTGPKVATALSNLPIQGHTGEEDVVDLRWLSHEAEAVDAENIGTITQDDPRMRELFLCVRDGWKEGAVPADLDFFYSNQSCLSLYMDCVMYSERLVVPKSCRERILELLHGRHLGVVRMKQTAQKFVFWQGIDKEIEKYVQQCGLCARMDGY
ncbi:uncharacterized protein K02A2.6-like [Sabethes cyaneus]|uniref:uncharacterized protein K02A2.6-like n=1 Tax=Sabethes cyaneus TaxID=53552 RepID=UPI00237E1581|nr:uncharacterized protein K02A2.6-like [Sabethes cyaneus]